MATFDNNRLATLTTEVDDGSRPTRAADGSMKIARLFSVPRYTFDVGYTLRSATEYQTLRDFYETNKYDEAITFIDPASLIEYSVMMMGPPQITRQYETFYDYSIVLTGTAV